MSRTLIVAILLALVNPIAVAEPASDTVYIRDTIYVPLRSGPSSQNRIVKRAVHSGTALELLEEDPETQWVRVRMEDGTEGWIQNQYIQKEPIAKAQLQAAESRLSELEANYQQTLLRVQELESDNEQLESANDELRDENQRLTDELDAIMEKADNVIAIDEENAELKQENKALTEELADVRSDNEELQDNARQEWFLRGAGVILLGLLFGFWIGRRIYHRHGGGWWT
ncbi:MAG: TIGR04211 family SH3 domain-containing protein [Pseudomonadales bacterium]